MYDDARTLMKCSRDNTGTFEIRAGVHQGSCISPLLFFIVMDAILENVRREVNIYSSSTTKVKGHITVQYLPTALRPLILGLILDRDVSMTVSRQLVYGHLV